MMVLLVSICSGIAVACIAELFLDKIYTRRMLSRVRQEIERMELFSRGTKKRTYDEHMNDWVDGHRLFSESVNLSNEYSLSRPVMASIAVGGGLFAAAGYMLSMSHIVGIAAAVVIVIPGLVYMLNKHRKNRHTRLVKRSIPDLLDLIVLCLRGGQSIQSTIRSVADELRLVYPALAQELDLVVRDLDLGHTIDVAMRRFADRVEIDELKTLSSMIRESLRLGTDIANALHEHAELIRKTRENEAEEKAQKAAMKILAPSLICIFPGTFVVILGPAVFQMIDAFKITK